MTAQIIPLRRPGAASGVLIEREGEWWMVGYRWPDGSYSTSLGRCPCANPLEANAAAEYLRSLIGRAGVLRHAAILEGRAA